MPRAQMAVKMHGIMYCGARGCTPRGLGAGAESGELSRGRRDGGGSHGCVVRAGGVAGPLRPRARSARTVESFISSIKIIMNATARTPGAVCAARR